MGGEIVMMNMPLVSIITPCYNAQAYIAEAIESVLAQTYEHWEMLIVDDASTDKSREIIQSYAEKDSRIKLIMNEQNRGTARSRNRAIEQARGEYIALLDSDDVWLSNKLEVQITLMDSEVVFVCFSAYFIMNVNSQTIGCYSSFEKVSYVDLLKTSSIGTLTMIYNAKKLGKFYFHQVGHEDYVMKLEMLKKVDFAYGIEEPLARYRIGGHSLSRNKLKAAKWQWYIYRNIEKLSLMKSVYYFLNYIYYGFTKYHKCT